VTFQPSARRDARRSVAPSSKAGADEPSDAELVELARVKDPRAARMVWDRYAGTVRGVLYRCVGPGLDVDDLTQEVFIGFFKNVRSMRDASSLRSFLVGISMRTAVTALRKRRVRRWLHLSEDGTMPEIASRDGDPRTREAVRRLYEILDELGDRDRLAFVLRHAEGQELTEAAATLGVSLATVKRMLRRAECHVLARAKDDDALVDWTEGSHV
jgi:RNA polymerase sigma-70 factor (ECF subfamily)